VRLRFAAADGSLHERELVADTGNPCALILGRADLGRLLRAPAPGTQTNFGAFNGGWLALHMPELGLICPVVGYGSDQVLQAVQLDGPDFAGLVGLPVLRMVEYGGDDTAFWVRKPAAVP
jgi:hypothetical protein